MINASGRHPPRLYQEISLIVNSVNNSFQEYCSEKQELLLDP